MKGILKRIISGIVTISLLQTIPWVIQAADEPDLQPLPAAGITFDASSDIGYTLQSGASIVKGRNGNALLSENINTSYAQIDDISAIQTISGDFTFSIWCYPKDDTVWTRLYDIGAGTGQYMFLAPSSSFAKGYPRFVMKNGGEEQILTSSKALNLNAWNNITVARQNGLTTMYVNGIPSGTTQGITINPSELGAADQNYLIKSQYQTDPYFNGMIDDFLIYNTALTAAEVQQLSAEAYQNELIQIASKYDRYVIESDFYNTEHTKLFQINGEKEITAAASVKNHTTGVGEVYAELYSYENGVSTKIAASSPVKIAVAEEAQIELNAVIPEGCEYLNLIVTDAVTGQLFDCGYLGVSSVSFPDASPPDSDATTFGAHDPTIFKDPVGGKYWAYSTHNVIFESEDLITWKKHDYGKTITVPEKSKEFIQRNYAGTQPNGTYWAPDILYVPEDTEHPYWFYVSVSCGLGGRNSVISLLKSKSPGIFDSEYVDCGVVLASKETTAYKTNAIDSNIYTDTDGKKYFVWGSFWQGIQAAPLNEDGTVEGIDYSSDASILSSSQNFGSPLFSVPNGVFGPEGPFMISNPESQYRYLFTSYGWLGTNYNIRIARNPLTQSMDAVLNNNSNKQFLDQNENPVGTAYNGQADKSTLWGYKMLGSYQLGDGIIYYGNGHNSVINDEGNWYLVDHSRKVADAAAYLQVRKMLWTDSGWPVVSPLAYAGEDVQTIENTMLYGTWDLSSVGQTIFKDGVTNVSSCTSSDADLPVLSSQIILQPDGRLGEDLGNWEFDGDHTVTITFTKDGNKANYEFYKAGDVLTLYVLTGYDKDQTENAVVMTGVDQNNITQFMKKSNASVADTKPRQLDTIPIPLEKSSGGNPVLGFDTDGNILYAGDPAATVIGDTVYLYAGHDTAAGDGYVIPEWVLYTSKDMLNWEYKGPVMSASSITWANDSTSAWASQMVEHSGKYYLYFCTWDKTDNGRQSIGVAVADSPEGPFIDKGTPLIQGSVTTPESSTFNDIDPTVWVETVDGTEHRYLGWGNGKYYICELNDDMISVQDQNHDNVIDMNDIKQQKIKNTGSDSFTEAPWLYKRDGKYYTFFAANWRETMAYAMSDSPYGPWMYGGQIMPPTATSNTNHPSVIEFKGRTYFIYHNGALPNGNGYRRSICIEELFFDENGRVVPLTETSTGLAGTASTITASDGTYLTHSDFKNSGSDAAYPISTAVFTTNEEDAFNTAWELVNAQYEPDTEEYISIQSVNKPGLYIAVQNDSVVLTQNADGKLQKEMTFKTVKGLSGAGVSFESISQPGKYLTVIGNRLTVSYGRMPETCSFTIGKAVQPPAQTVPPMPTPTPVPDLTPDIKNNFDDKNTGILIEVSGNEQKPYTQIEGMALYVGTRASATGSNISIETGGFTGNALALNSGRFVSSSRGPRMAIHTPVIIEDSTVSATMQIKPVNNGVLRYNDSTSSDVGTELTGLLPNAWNELKITVTDTQGERIRTISVNGKEVAADGVDTFPVLWGTTVNDTYSKVLIDDFTVTTIAGCTIDSVTGKTITIHAGDPSAIVYAAKYAVNGELEAVEIFRIPQKGNAVFTASFIPDSVFIWSENQMPYAVWKK